MWLSLGVERCGFTSVCCKWSVLGGTQSMRLGERTVAMLGCPNGAAHGDVTNNYPTSILMDGWSANSWTVICRSGLAGADPAKTTQRIKSGSDIKAAHSKTGAVPTKTTQTITAHCPGLGTNITLSSLIGPSHTGGVMSSYTRQIHLNMWAAKLKILADRSHPIVCWRDVEVPVSLEFT